MRIVKFLLPDGSLNEVTSHYVSLIEKSISSGGFSHIRVSSINQIDSGDIVVTILSSDAIKAIILKKARVIHWFQGIGPEEYALLHSSDTNRLRTKFVILALEAIEKYVLKNSIKRIFVSDAMKDHYQNKYKMEILDYVAIPCYNTKICNDIDSNRYKEPRFIYVGSAYAWQKLEMTLDIFKSVQKIIPSASLSIMTKDIEIARNMISVKCIDNASVSYVSADKLESIMIDFKYAFLIRDNININQVSTPTKMANYISSGLIPIYSDVINSFKANIDLGDYGISISSNLSVEEIARKIASHHAATQLINTDALNQKRQQIFNDYYSDSINITRFAKYFSDI